MLDGKLLEGKNTPVILDSCGVEVDSSEQPLGRFRLWPIPGPRGPFEGIEDKVYTHLRRPSASERIVDRVAVLLIQEVTLLVTICKEPARPKPPILIGSLDPFRPVKA